MKVNANLFHRKMLISIVFLLVLSPVSSLQGTHNEKKNDTTKLMGHTISHNVPKLVTTSTTKAHAASSKSANQTLMSTPKPVVDGLQKPVPSLQDTLSEKKNSSTKSRVNTINLNVQKPVTTLSNSKMKNQTQSASSKTSSISQTLPSTTKPAVDGVQKPGPALPGKLNENKNSTAKSRAHTSGLNVPKLVTTALKTKMKNQTHPTSSFTSSINQTPPSTTKIVVDGSSLSEKKNSTLKSTDQTIKVNVSKTVTIVLNTKTKNQTQSSSSKISNVGQPQDVAEKHVPSLQDPLSENKNSTVKSTAQTVKVVTTLSNTKISSTSSKVNQTLPFFKKPDVDTIQKPVQSVKSTVNTIKLNVQKPVTTLLKTKMKDQTKSTSSTTSRVNQTLSSSSKHDMVTVQKPVQSVQTQISEKKNVTTKSIINTINLNAQKPVTTLLKTKMKNQIQSTSAKNSSIDQSLPSSSMPAVDVVQKSVSSLPATLGEQKNTTTKSVSHTINVNPSKPVFTKMKNQTLSASSKPSSNNETLSSTPKSAVDVQKPGPSLQVTLNKKKNSTLKSKTQTISHNVPKLTTLFHIQTNSSKINQTQSMSQTINVNSSKPLSTALNTKTKKLTQSTSSKISKVNQTDAFTGTPVVDGVQNPTKDKPAESSPVKVVITEGCVQQESHIDAGNITKVRETELSLNPGSPLVMTHHINLIQGACAGGCDTQMAALRDRVEFLEKEMSVIKKMCVQCSGEQCPKNCSGQGKCEGGKCVCFQGFSGPDCSGKTCPSNCNKKGKCVKGKCMCQTGYTGLDCSKGVDKKIPVTIETVTMKMSTVKTDTKSVKTKPDKTIFVKIIDTKDPKKDTTAKPTLSTGKVQSNTTKGDKNIKTIGQVLLMHEGRTTKGKTTVTKLVLDNKSKTDKNNNLKDEPVYQNVAQRSVKKVNETSKVLENKGASNVTTSRTKVTTRTAGDQGLESKTDVTFTKKDKKLFHGNVTTILQAEMNPDKHVNGTSIESKTHMKHFNRTSSRLSVIGSVEVHNITSTGFILSWETPKDTFKNFTVTRRGIRAGNEDSENIQDGAAAENVTDVQRPGSDRTSTKVHGNKLEGRTVKKFSQVIAGTARSYHFKGLQPQMRYSVSLFGSGLGLRSKIHRLTLSTGPEPPTDLMFSNITETSVSVSWGKPKSIVAEFKVTYTNIVTGESGSMSVDSQLSHVLLSKLSAGSTYDITVSSVLETLKSEPITASVTTVPDSPTELKVVNITDTKALLVWKPSQAKVDSYILSYGTTKSPNVTITVTLSGSTVEHQLRGLHRSSLYMVKITSQVNRLQSSPVSTTFTTGSGVKLQIVTPAVTFHSAVISWRAPRVAFKSYRLTYQLNEEVQELILNPSVTHYELTGLAASSNYTVKIEGERDGQYISFVSAEFTTAMLPHPYPKDCSEVQINGMKESGEAEIYLEGKDGEPVWVYCDMKTDGGGWTVFQRRMDGSTDFFRSWRDYSKGFGLLSGEFWLGNDILYTLTSLAPMSLRIDLRSGNDTAFAHYANFKVNSEANHYAIELSGYSGTAGDSMKYHNGRPFSTKDKDPNTLSIHCAKAYMGGWWYKNCYKANLNGLYASYSDNKGVVWIDWKGKDASLPFTEMKLRPSYFSQTIPTTPTTQG
ncbi:hypothetical protein R3I93_008813 [Phoxinus phoxinus]|uniref:Tenascin n=1 Tax=Phoxinus phoxinus TaxID=58324 RepID=A0AAN9D3V6_9TELE